MFAGLRPRCKMGNDGYQVCTSSTCNSSAIICNQQKCQCSKLHKHCHLFILKINILIDTLNVANYEQKVKTSDIVLALYDDLYKLVKTQRDQCELSLNNDNCSLNGDKKKVFQFMKNGVAHELTGSIIHKACKQIANQKRESENMSKLTVDFFQTAKKLKEQIKDILYTTKQLLQPTRTNHKFIKSLCSENLQVQDEGRKITILKKQNTDHYALISGSLERYQKPKKFRFKLQNQKKDYVFIGICHKQSVAKRNYKFEYYKGLYVINSSNGYLRNYAYPKQQKLTEFRWNSGQIVQIQFDPINNRVSFHNTEQNVKYSMPFKRIQNNQLYLCVSLFQVGSQIQFLGLTDQYKTT